VFNVSADLRRKHIFIATSIYGGSFMAAGTLVAAKQRWFLLPPCLDFIISLRSLVVLGWIIWSYHH